MVPPAIAGPHSSADDGRAAEADRAGDGRCLLALSDAASWALARVETRGGERAFRNAGNSAGARSSGRRLGARRPSRAPRKLSPRMARRIVSDRRSGLGAALPDETHAGPQPAAGQSYARR